MSRSSAPAGTSTRLRTVTAAALVAFTAGGFAALTACGSSGSDSGGSTTPPPPASANLTGGLPSDLESLASEAASAASSAASEASEAASSAGAAASSFAASVEARATADEAAAKAALAGVHGKGNATQDVQLSGLPKKETGGLHAVVVTITNHGSSTASFAVKVEFADSDGKVVDSTVVGAKDVGAGKQATPVAFSIKDVDKPLFPRVAQAQRY
ncbi:hypothetical protein [Actinacidiphila acidipaludis]|uniref:Lipoprotein n=1 Tax=Actinacidiphila acidipaludis TaxID=2873382 RepID=A0ABS7Q8K6_9ACTN|nr:hypothetical protein [Streptomyces acidipaludis]MBY8878357.1 hypothetical protein [Streptomyces acidipaludis]